MAAAVLLLSGAANRSPQQLASHVAGEVMSPFCEGVTLRECASPEADRLRVRILAWAENGFTESEIMDRLVSEYDSGIIASPAFSGKGVIPWLGAVAIVSGALALGISRVRRFGTHRPDVRAESAASHPATHLRARLEEKLAHLRKQ